MRSIYTGPGPMASPLLTGAELSEGEATMKPMTKRQRDIFHKTGRDPRPDPKKSDTPEPLWRQHGKEKAEEIGDKAAQAIRGNCVDSDAQDGYCIVHGGVFDGRGNTCDRATREWTPEPEGTYISLPWTEPENRAAWGDR